MLQHVDQFRVVDFQQHSGDFPCQFWEHALNQGEQSFAQHLFLLARWCLSQHTGGQGFLALDEYGSLWWLLLLRLLRLHWSLGRLGRHNWGTGHISNTGSVLEVGSHAGWIGGLWWHAWSSHGGGHVHWHSHWTGAHGSASAHHFIVLMSVSASAHLRSPTKVWLDMSLALLGPTGHTSWSNSTLRFASSGLEKHTNPNPFDRPSSCITFAEVIVPMGQILDVVYHHQWYHPDFSRT